MKKVIIITHYWPPAGGGGVQRWLKFVSYLPEFGWEPVVVIPEGADYPNTDETLLKDVIPNLQELRVPIWEPYSLFRRFAGLKKTEKVNAGFLFDDEKQNWKQQLAMWIRGNLLIPDPRIFWIRPTIKAISKNILELAPDLIITTGPPHSIHLIGMRVSKKYHLPWIADFRDPWSKIDYLEKFKLTSFAKRIQERLEGRVLRNASLVLTVSSEWEKELKGMGATRTACITNGFDEKDFKHYQSKRLAQFTIAHLGFISSFRNPTVLWDAVNAFIQEELGKDAIRLYLAGNVDKGVFAYLDKLSELQGAYEFAGYLDHNMVIHSYAEASVLLLLLNNSDNAAGHIPGKLFEYLRAGKPILALGKPGGDVDRILEETGCGQLFNFDDRNGIIGFLQSIYHYEWAYEPRHDRIRAFERRALTGALAELMNHLVQKPTTKREI